MARNGKTIDETAFEQPGARVIDVPLTTELRESYGAYGLTTIYDRAIPDARDGLKPVHRRILYTLHTMNLRPDRAYMKAGRVVGEVMGRLHPHGDTSIYDAMVRLAQDFNQNAILVDGKGNWGFPDDPAAAYRYTECRQTPFAQYMVQDLDEDTVDWKLAYTNDESEPKVLPSAFPNLLVNGGEGIAVGMASKLIPHNLGEVIAGLRYLIAHPNASLDKLMEFVPGPDLPTGGTLLGMDEVRRAYETGRGVVRLRAKMTVGPSSKSRGRQAITVTEFPFQAKPESIVESIREEVLGQKIIDKKTRKPTGQREASRLPGVAAVNITTDMTTAGDQMVIELKAGANPTSVIADLYRLTNLEASFGINNNVLVNGQPQELGLKPLMEAFLAHRFDVVTRRTRFRLRKAEERRHLVEGLLVALDNVDAVVKIIRSSRDTAEAKQRLVSELKNVTVRLGGKGAKRSLDEVQAQHILDMPLRRLVALEVESLRAEWDDLTRLIGELQEILDDDKVLRRVVSDELAAIAKAYATDRKTTLMDGDLQEVLAASAPVGPAEVADDPCSVVLSVTGLVARTAAESEEVGDAKARRRTGRGKHDAIVDVVASTARGQVLLVTNRGRAFKTDVLTLPVLPDAPGGVSVRGGVSSRELLPLESGERVVTIAPMLDGDAGSGPGLALGTRLGAVKVVRPEWPVRSDEFTVIGLADGDEVVAGSWLSAPEDVLVFVTSDAQVLRFDAAKVRPQGLSGGGMAGVKLADGAHVVGFNAVRFGAADRTGEDGPLVIVATGDQVKVTPLSEYPAKGRATGGVASLRFLAKMNQAVTVGWVGGLPAACSSNGSPVDLPDPDPRRAGSGVPCPDGLDLIGHLVTRGE